MRLSFFSKVAATVEGYYSCTFPALFEARF
jgi:hypothetical protein